MLIVFDVYSAENSTKTISFAPQGPVLIILVDLIVGLFLCADPKTTGWISKKLVCVKGNRPRKRLLKFSAFLNKRGRVRIFSPSC